MIRTSEASVNLPHESHRGVPKVPPWWIMASYLIVCAVALPWHLHRVGPDASAYLTIARKYHAWDFPNAVNGFWSPLVSWLIAPFLGFGFATDVTAKVLEVAIGAGVIGAAWWLARRLQLPASACSLTSVSLVAPTAMYALKDTTPDLLVAGLLVGYLAVVVGEDYPRSPWQGAACGLFGAMAYLAKAYALPFFLAHYVIVSVYLLTRRNFTPAERRRLLVVTATGLLVFGALAGAWVGVLSQKYSRFTFATTGAYQFRLVAPGSLGHPLDKGGLFPPTNATAISAWEDPSELAMPDFATAGKPPARATPSKPVETVPAKPIDPVPAKSVNKASKPGGDIVTWLVRRYRHNLTKLCGTLFRLTPVWPLIFLGLMLACWREPRGPVRDRCMILLATLLIYPAGYVQLFIEYRYFWFMTSVLAATAFLLPTVLPFLRAGRWRSVWVIVTALSFTLWPAWIMARTWGHVLERIATLSGQLHSTVPPGSRVASDAEWGMTNSLAFHLDARYHGILRPGGSAEEHEKQLREQGIHYVVIWGDPAGYPFLESARELPADAFKQARLGRVPRLFALPAALR